MKKGTPHSQQSSRSQGNRKAGTSLSNREHRLLAALLGAKCGLSRESVDKATPTSNGPHYVEQLRRKLRLEIPCHRIEFVTRDGQKSWYGHYCLTAHDRNKLASDN